MLNLDHWAAMAAIDTNTVTNKRDGYTQHFAEKGMRLTHYLVRDSDGAESPRAPYDGIAKLDGYVSVSAYFGVREEIMTPTEFVDAMAVK